MDSTSAIVIDCGIGNIDSVVNSIKRAGISVITCADLIQLKNTSATSIVLPGVGTFGRMMSLLDSGGWIPVLSDLVIEQKKTVSGHLCRYADIGKFFSRVWARCRIGLDRRPSE